MTWNDGVPEDSFLVMRGRSLMTSIKEPGPVTGTPQLLRVLYVSYRFLHQIIPSLGFFPEK